MINQQYSAAQKASIVLISALLILLYCFPLYLLINVSLRDYQDLSSRLALTKNPIFDHYVRIASDPLFWTALKNTILLFVLDVLILIPIASLAGYGLSRSSGFVVRSIRTMNVLIMMIPGTALLVGTYSLMVKLRLTNSIPGLALLSAGTGMTSTMFFYTTFTSMIPVELDEAASIDGAGVIRTYFSVIFPQLKAITITRIISVLTGCWNSYLMPMYVLTKAERFTLLLYVRKLFSGMMNIPNVPLAYTGCLFMILPILVFYFAMQKYIIGGQLDSAVKG